MVAHTSAECVEGCEENCPSDTHLMTIPSEKIKSDQPVALDALPIRINRIVKEEDVDKELIQFTLSPNETGAVTVTSQDPFWFGTFSFQYKPVMARNVLLMRDDKFDAAVVGIQSRYVHTRLDRPVRKAYFFNMKCDAEKGLALALKHVHEERRNCQSDSCVIVTTGEHVVNMKEYVCGCNAGNHRVIITRDPGHLNFSERCTVILYRAEQFMMTPELVNNLCMWACDLFVVCENGTCAAKVVAKHVTSIAMCSTVCSFPECKANALKTVGKQFHLCFAHSDIGSLRKDGKLLYMLDLKSSEIGVGWEQQAEMMKLDVMVALKTTLSAVITKRKQEFQNRSVHSMMRMVTYEACTYIKEVMNSLTQHSDGKLIRDMSKEEICKDMRKITFKSDLWNSN